ncbi:MAG: magnesium/cobalt transporter CorA [Thermoanaerobaculia bacterium]
MAKISVVLFRSEGGVCCGGRELLERPQGEGELLWVDVEGFDSENQQLVQSLGFHPLAVEETFTLQHQPKYEEYDGCLFTIVRGIDFNTTDNELDTLKLACFLQTGRLVTVHRAPMRSVAAVHSRLKETGKAPRGGLDHLLYMLFDELISLYFPLVDELGLEIERIEDEMFQRPRQSHLEAVLEMRRRLTTLRRVMLPHRQVFNHLATGSADEIDDREAFYFRDVYDEVLRLTDGIDMLREQLSSLRDTYLSVLSQRTNDVMKVLTIISSMLLPMTVIAGIYGMNFEFMPELHKAWGYPVALGLMVTVAGGMMLWFRKKDWI